MRQVASKGSAKAFYLDPAHVLKRLKTAARQAIVAFPQISEVLLFGSLARGTQTGLSHIDLAILLSSESAQVDPLERARPYHRFFCERLPMGLDVIVCREEVRAALAGLLDGAVSLARRRRRLR